MELNTYLLEKAGVDFEHGFSRYAGCAYQFNNALLSAGKKPVFERISRSHTSENICALYVWANELKNLADNLGMAYVYEAANVLTELLRGNHCADSIGAALATLEAVVKTTFSGIREACA